MKPPAIIVSPSVFNTTQDIGYEDMFSGTSYLSLKSSVLSPSSTRLTNQYMALEQLRAHYEMIARAKAQVDTSSPRSMHSSLSRIGQKRRETWRTRSSTSLYSVNGLSRTASPEILHNHYREIPIKQTGHFHQKLEVAMVPDDDLTIGDKVSWYLNTVPSFKDKENTKGKQNVTHSSGKAQMNNQQQQSISVADKISWYLEAVQQGAFTSDLTSSVNGDFSDNLSSSSIELLHSNHSSRKRYLKASNDHTTAQKINNSTYTLKSKTMSRISGKNQTKSKLLDMKCYHPATQRKKYKLKKLFSPELENAYDDSSNNSDDDDDQVLCHESKRADDICQVPERLKRPIATKEQKTHDSYSSPVRRYRSSLDLISRNETKYLAFIQNVTEDILNTGIYTDRAIKKALDFHMRRQNDLDSNIVKKLMEQFLDDLCISKEETSVSNVLDTLMDSTGRSTPPERDNVHFTTNDNGTEIEHVFPMSITVTDLQTKSNTESNDNPLEEFGSILSDSEIPDKDQNIFD